MGLSRGGQAVRGTEGQGMRRGGGRGEKIPWDHGQFYIRPSQNKFVSWNPLPYSLTLKFSSTIFFAEN